MLAAPGAGKGTQADRLAARYGIEHIASGEILRAEVAAATAVGEKAKDYLDRGDLVPDDLLLDIIAGRVLTAALAGGYVLDGFPRTLAQAEAAHRLAVELDGVTLQAVLHLEVGADELRSRLRARASREGRPDDTEATIEHRLEVFASQTEPLLEYYRSREILHTIDGERQPDEVTAEIVALLDSLGLGLGLG
ncbi:adenylate kinase [Acidiferrimicrobium sp. IK]|uniref:adenylate kinase n=1 Tax=Acidiferrimicrobium sp. IK TaxID=2871700 RepID=UPI0021CB0CE2|nr:adenylate kinase [Acidiferrimicrobium sp. IK]MCU4184633.1 adenylate kinase [Acidiferrimicrobium sp. IK]